MTRVSAKFTYEQFAQETPSGTVNGANATFSISATPETSAAVFLFLDAVPQIQGTDYTLTGTTILMTTPPAFGQALYAYYLKQK